jgi:hypothetical protein
LYHRSTAKGTASLPQPFDGLILEIGPRLEGCLSRFSAIQTHSSCRFLLAVDSLGLRWSGSSSQFIDPPQDFPKQVPGHGNFGQLERDGAGPLVATYLPPFTRPQYLLAMARMPRECPVSVDFADFRRISRNPKKNVGILYTGNEALELRIAKCLNSLH